MIESKVEGGAGKSCRCRRETSAAGGRWCRYRWKNVSNTRDPFLASTSYRMRICYLYSSPVPSLPWIHSGDCVKSDSHDSAGNCIRKQ